MTNNPLKVVLKPINLADLIDRPHSILGGSSADRWSNCPGSVGLEATCEKKLAGSEADLGTITHHYLLDLSLTSFLNHKISGSDVEINAQDDTMAEIILKAISEIWTKVLDESITDKIYGIEHKFFLNKDLDSFGYVDFWCVYIDDKGKKVGIIYDYKNGIRHSVQADKNAQLAFYACALQNMLIAKGKALDYVRAYIYQPRVPKEEAIRETRFTASQLATWNKKFMKAANDILVTKKTSFKAGDWCTYCRAKGKCPTYAKHLSKTSSLRILDADIEEQTFPAIDTIPDEVASRLIRHTKQIKAFLSNLADHAIVRNMEGNPIPDTKCVESRPRRKWKDDTESIGKDLMGKGFELLEIFTLKPKGITVIENMLATRFTRKEAKTFLESLTEIGHSSIQLVSADDPRPAIENSSNLILINERDEDD